MCEKVCVLVVEEVEKEGKLSDQRFMCVLVSSSDVSVQMRQFR